jgi:peptidoglycan-associated lipoprotein
MRVNVRITTALVAFGLAAACGKKQPPPAPVPQQANNSNSTPTATNNPSASSNAGDSGAAEAARNRAILTETVRFAYDESVLSAASQETLRSKVGILRSNPAIRVRVEGHADERGSVEYNLALGLRRAHAAREFLMGFGIDGSRIDVETYGEDRPASMGHDESAWAANRRDEFVIVAGLSGR